MSKKTINRTPDEEKPAYLHTRRSVHARNTTAYQKNGSTNGTRTRTHANGGVYSSWYSTTTPFGEDDDGDAGVVVVAAAAATDFVAGAICYSRIVFDYGCCCGLMSVVAVLWERAGRSHSLGCSDPSVVFVSPRLACLYFCW